MKRKIIGLMLIINIILMQFVGFVNVCGGSTVVHAEGVGVKAIAAGGWHTVALKEDGTVIAWGDNRFGESTIPEGLTDVKAISAGWNHTVALKEDGTVVAWGDDRNGRQCTIPEGLTDVKAIAAGRDHTVALKEDGTVVAWGWNEERQCIIPEGLKNVKAIAAGLNHTVALKEDGTVVAWGWNEEGQCTIPEGLKNVKAIAAGRDHTVALKEDGTVVVWGGSSQYGQCTVPEGLKNVKAIAAGVVHTLALKEDGTVVAWGGNVCGECEVPEGLKNVKSIAAGGQFSVALKEDGTIVAWGNNDYNVCTIPEGLNSPSTQPTQSYIYDTKDAGDTIDLPTTELSAVTDKATAITAVETAVTPLTDEQKQSATGSDKLALFAEEAIAKSAGKLMSGETIQITNDTIKDLDTKATETKSEVEDKLIQNGVSLIRELKSEVNIKTDDLIKVTVKVDNALNTKADGIKVETPFANVSFATNNITAPVSLTLEETSTKKVSVQFDTNTTTTVKVSFPGMTGDTKYKAVVDENGKPVGGKFNPATNCLEAKIKASGIYSVINNEKSFDDIKGKANEMQEAIKQLASKGIISGKSEKSFAPDDKISRAEISALIVRALAKLDPNEDGGFSDVTRSNWYFGVAGSSKKNKIISGYPDKTFKGDTVIPKDQIIVVTARVLENEMKYKVPEDKEAYLSYNDRKSIPDWGASQIALATQANLVVRRTDGNFVSDDEMTRGDAAIILKRMFDKVW